MAIIRIGVRRTLIIPKTICEEQNIDVGDFLNIDIKDGKIILSKVDNIDDVNKIKGKERKNKIVKDKEVKLIEIENNSLLKTGHKSLKELNDIPLSGSEEFKPNLLESMNYSKKYYSKCGLLCRTKTKYIQNYCNNCRGQMLAKEVRKIYCPYYIDNIKDELSEDFKVITDNQLNTKKVSTTVNKNNDNDKNKLRSLEVNSTNEQLIQTGISNDKKIVQEQEQKRIVKNIFKNINTLDKEINSKITFLNISNNAINNTAKENVTNKMDDVTIEVVRHRHHYQCYKCNEYYKVGFMINSEHFYCKNCASKMFKKYMKEKGRLKNV